MSFTSGPEGDVVADAAVSKETVESAFLVDPYAEALMEAAPANMKSGAAMPDAYRYKVGVQAQYLFRG